MIRYGVVFLAAMILAGCSANKADTAWQLMERQQEEQAQLRQYDSAQSRAQMPSQQQLVFGMIQDAQRDGRYFASLAYIDSYTLEFGMSPQIMLLKADALRVTGNLVASEQLYRDLLKTPHEGQARHGMGLLAGQQGHYAHAVQELSIAARLMPAQAVILNDLGYAMLRAGDTQGARLPLGQAAELEPDNGTIISNLVLFLLLSNDRSRAEQLRTQAGLSDESYRSITVLAHQIRAEASVPDKAISIGPDITGHEPLLW